MGFIFSANLVAGEMETGDRLIKEGWKKLSVAELIELKSYTAVGKGWASYVGPIGANYAFRLLNDPIRRGRRIITSDGKFCSKWTKENPWRCRFIWIRGKDWLNLRPNRLYV